MCASDLDNEDAYVFVLTTFSDIVPALWEGGKTKGYTVAARPLDHDPWIAEWV